MTEQERQQAFLKAIEELQTRYGFTLVAQAVPRQLGEVIQVEARIVLAPIDKWQPPKEETKEEK